MYLAQVEPISNTINQLAGRDIAIIVGIGLIVFAVAVVILCIVLLKNVTSQGKGVEAQGENAISISKMATAVSRMSEALNKKIDLDYDQIQQLKLLEDSNTKMNTSLGELRVIVTELRTQQEKWFANPDEIKLATRELRDAAIELRRTARELEQREQANKLGIEVKE